MKTKYYKGSQQHCQDYHNALHGSGVLPVVDGAYQMLNWSEGPEECVDGDHCYPQPPQALLDHHGVSGDLQDTIRANYVNGKLTLLDNKPDVVQPPEEDE